MANGFKKTVRENVWLKVLLSSTSGGGKTYSSLILAEEIAKNAGGEGIAFISTEGSRTKYYADKFNYDSMELEDHSPEAYIEALDMAINNGYKVAIIDSMSHEWQWLNDVHDKMPGNSFTNWGRLKPRHKAFMDKILYSPIHVICCSRGKTEWTLEDKNGKQVPKKVGMGTEQDKQINYEYTVSLILDADTHVASTDKDNTGIFDGKYEILTAKHGKALFDWANSGAAPASTPKPVVEAAPVTDDIKSIKTEIISVCKEKGGTKNSKLMEVLKSFTNGTGNPNNITDIQIAKDCLEAISQIGE